MAGLVRPRSYPIRDIKSNNQEAGMIYQQKRFTDHGGLSGPGKWPKGNPFSVEAPTKLRTAETSNRSLSE